MFTHASRIAVISAAAALGFAAAGQAAIDAPANSWVSVTGEVVSTDEGEMRIDYGQGIVTVTSASFGAADGDSSARPARVGDDVTVHGWVDDGFFTEKTINAASIHNASSGQVEYGMSDPSLELDFGFLTASMNSSVDADASFSGYVTDIDGREFTLITGGGRELRVHTGGMPRNPLDDVGAQRIDDGDRVSVTGELEPEVFDSAEFVAQDITVLHDLNKPGP